MMSPVRGLCVALLILVTFAARSAAAQAPPPEVPWVPSPALWSEQLRIAPDPAQRRAAAQALGKTAEPAHRPVLEAALLGDPDPLVRATAAWALAAVGSLDALPALGRAASADADPGVRQWALFAGRHLDPSFGGAPPPAEIIVKPAEPAPAPAPEPEPEPAPEPPSHPVWRYLRGLGGLEVSAFRGTANVETAFERDGVSQVVGTGNAQSDGYRIAFYGFPERSGFFWHPTLGFVSQRITLAGFRETVPSFTPADAERIPAVATDPRTGTGVDAEAPNTYRLELKSVYLGQRIGGTKVWDRPTVRWALTLQGIVNLAEYRDFQYQIGDYDSRTAADARDNTRRGEFLQSGGFAGGLALAIKPLHLAIRLEVKYELFRQFKFPKQVDFRGPVRFNPEIENFEREVLKLDGVDLRTFDATLAASLFF